MPLTPVMVALLRLQRLHVALQSYRERMARLLKDIETSIFSSAPQQPPTSSFASVSSAPHLSSTATPSSNSSSPSPTHALSSSPHAAVSALLVQSNTNSATPQPVPIKDIAPDTFAPMLTRYFAKLLKKLRRAARLSSLLATLIQAAQQQRSPSASSSSSSSTTTASSSSQPLPPPSSSSSSSSRNESSLSARLRAELSESYGSQVQQDCAFTVHSLADLARSFFFSFFFVV